MYDLLTRLHASFARSLGDAINWGELVRATYITCSLARRLIGQDERALAAHVTCLLVSGLLAECMIDQDERALAARIARSPARRHNN